ncbi:MAG: XRE family transcriptional regulator [Desulfovibrio sp.]|jgi:transcriptional regulator with XRE-family HTH domain|nr:XRE family transcriptional regulator [Desulfovibrio sp.]
MSDDAAIGARIRAFRERREVGLADLADNTGLKPEFIEKLESGEMYPSLGPLQKISRALGVRLGTFLDDQEVRDPIISRLGAEVEESDPLHALQTGHEARPEYVHRSLAAGKADRNMEPFFITMLPDGGEEHKLISHQGEEFMLVLKGELLVIYGREKHILKPGETIYYNSIVPHHVGAAGGEPAEILAVMYSA